MRSSNQWQLSWVHHVHYSNGKITAFKKSPLEEETAGTLQSCSSLRRFLVSSVFAFFSTVRGTRGRKNAILAVLLGGGQGT